MKSADMMQPVIFLLATSKCSRLLFDLEIRFLGCISNLSFQISFHRAKTPEALIHEHDDRFLFGLSVDGRGFK